MDHSVRVGVGTGVERVDPSGETFVSIRGNMCVLRGLLPGEDGESMDDSCPARGAVLPSSKFSPSSMRISGRENCGTDTSRESALDSIRRRNRRDQYSVLKNPITTLRRTASSTRWRRVRRRRNSSSLVNVRMQSTLAEKRLPHLKLLLSVIIL